MLRPGAVAARAGETPDGTSENRARVAAASRSLEDAAVVVLAEAAAVDGTGETGAVGVGRAGADEGTLALAIGARAGAGGEAAAVDGTEDATGAAGVGRAGADEGTLALAIGARAGAGGEVAVDDGTGEAGAAGAGRAGVEAGTPAVVAAFDCSSVPFCAISTSLLTHGVDLSTASLPLNRSVTSPYRRAAFKTAARRARTPGCAGCSSTA